MVTPIFRGQVEKGRLKINKRIEFFQYLNNLKGKIEVIVRKVSKRRSNSANSYYWAVVVPTVAQTEGETNYLRMHEILKLQFNPTHGKFHGQDIPVGGSTRKMDTFKFQDYVNRIIADYAQRGVRFPTPDEYYARDVVYQDE